jgi:hypothetical protein
MSRKTPVIRFELGGIFVLLWFGSNIPENAPGR